MNSPSASGGQASGGAVVVNVGRVDEFDGDSEDWPLYQEQLEQYFVANDVTRDEKKRAILLSVCGRKTYRVLRNLTTPDKPADKGFAELCTLLSQHFSPKPSEIAQSFKFPSHHRNTGESVSEYVAGLRRLTEHCNFGDTLDRRIRDQLVCGINDDHIQRRLLSESSLTLDSAIKLARGFESAMRDVADIKGSKSAVGSSRRSHGHASGGSTFIRTCERPREMFPLWFRSAHCEELSLP